MKFKYYLLTGLCTASLFTLSSCFDSNYDLSDLDTNAKFEMKDLTIPLNIDHITLEQALDIKDGNEIVKEQVDGKMVYAIKKSGSFNSETIEVKKFSIDKPTLNSRTMTLELTDLRNVLNYVDEVNAYYDIKDSFSSDFKTQALNLDESIKYIKAIGVVGTVTDNIKISGLSAALLEKVTIDGLKILYPKGLIATANMGKYDKKTGILDLSSENLKPDSKGNIKITLDVTGVDVEESDIVIDYDKRSLDFEGKVYIKEGRVNLRANKEDKIPATASFSSSPSISKIDVKTFTGRIEYKVNDFDVDPIYLNSVPEVLSQSGTSIIIDNPQIYMSFNNPLSEYKTVFETGMEFTSINGDKEQTYAIDDKTFRTSPDSINQFVLSPSVPLRTYGDYTNPKHVKFTSLSRVFADVDGMPKEMKVNVIAPNIPEQDIKDFRLGEKIKPVRGKYDFYAPLKLSEKSVIIYTDTLHGWNKDVDDMKFSKAVIDLDVTTEVPMTVELWASPVDCDNEVINNIKSNTVTIDAYAKKQHITLTMEGEIEHLNGMIFKAVSKSINNGETLGPDMKIYVDNFKLTVNGSIETEL